MKKLLSALIAAVMVLSPVCVQAEDSAAVYDELTVGNTTPMKGDFFTDMWGNATSDIDVRMLIHSYPLVEWDGEQGMFTVNPVVVSGFAVSENRNKDRSYRISIYDDLKYSDGSPITAADYAFSVLLSVSPAMKEIGAETVSAEYIKGCTDYVNGSSRSLAGVRLLGDHEFSVEVDHNFLPYFYELSLINYQPYPISVIAPGCTVKDDGSGVYVESPEGGEAFSSEMLARTILDPETGYRSHPSVTSGPYVLTSFDGETAEFELNPYYKGDASGHKPVIEKLTYKPADNATMIEDLENGEFDLLNKIADSETIGAGLALLQNDPEKFTRSSYPRTGLSFLSFCGESGKVRDVRVRQAIAWCLRRKEAADAYEGAYGLPVNGYYGLGQWMYSVLSGSMPYPGAVPEENASDDEKAAYERDLEIMETLNLDGVEAYESGSDEENAARAGALFAEAGWNLGESGGSYEGGLRYRDEDGQLVPLSLIIDYPEGSRIGGILEKSLGEPLEMAGAELVMNAVPMQELLAEYYGETERSCDMIFLATNFDVVFDPALSFETAGDGSRTWNHTNISDEELFEAARAMSHTEPGKVREYLEHYVDFEERFAEVLPVLPVYSNVYFDFYVRTLHDYEPGLAKTWPQAIVKAYLGDAGVASEEALAEVEEGDVVEID